MVLTDSNEELSAGAEAPGFILPGADGETYSLADREEQLVLVVFMCNHCPYVIPKIPELNRIAEDYEGKVAVLGINSNESKKHPEDSFERMQALARDGTVRFPYLHDEDQAVAKAYGAVCTPDPFLFDEKRKLVYHGRIDDTHGDKPATTHELYEAIGALLDGEKLPEAQPSRGCSIKWR